MRELIEYLTLICAKARIPEGIVQPETGCCPECGDKTIFTDDGYVKMEVCYDPLCGYWDAKLYNMPDQGAVEHIKKMASTFGMAGWRQCGGVLMEIEE